MAKAHARSPIDWFVYTSALPMEHPDSPELRFCQEHHIRTSKRDEFLNHILSEKNLKLIAIAGTHGKTTTTAMLVWLFEQLQLPCSYLLPAKTSFAEMGHLNPKSEYFVYECDEFDRNFLQFHPHLSLITGIDWDHPDIYPTREVYQQAFQDFVHQSAQALLWQPDAQTLQLSPSDTLQVLDEDDAAIKARVQLAGRVNRQDAWLAVHGMQQLFAQPLEMLISTINRFPGLSRRFEQVAPNLYSDYAHTPPKILGALQLAHELAGENVVVIYEGLHNTRQHFIKNELAHLFDTAKRLYIVPSYLAREDQNLPLLSPEDIKNLLSPKAQAKTAPASLNDELKQQIQAHLDAGDLVLCLSAGGGHSLDEWLHKRFR